MGYIQDWGKKIGWEKRIKAVCKPCWEIKYCPYGPLVEDFPLAKERSEQSCRIFGHDCPVFYVAEPLTETKQLRNISRTIPRNVQFRVLKRDNQICSQCGHSVLDEDVEFDHLIPWSKGGSSDEHNIKLLCRKCNRKKSKKYEEIYLVNDITEHFRRPIPFDTVEITFKIIELLHLETDLINKEVTADDFRKLFERRKVTIEDEKNAELINDIRSYFLAPKPTELSKKKYEALKYRWGFIDSRFHKLAESSNKYKIGLDELFELDHSFVSRIGFYTKLSEKEKLKWKKL